MIWTPAAAACPRSSRGWRTGTALALGFVLLLPAGCDREAAFPGDELQGIELAPASPPPARAPAPFASRDMGLADADQGSAQVPPTRQLIRRAHIGLEVDGIDAAVERLQALAVELGGHVAAVQLTAGREQQRHASVALRIPAPRLDEAIAAVRELGRVQRLSVSTDDVTDQLTDLDARVSNARQLEERLLRLLETRTGDLQQVLTAERELARVRTEIEMLEARRRSLGEQVALSTLEVVLGEPRPILALRPGENVLADALRQAWRNFVWTIAGIIRFIGAALPIVLLVGALVAVYVAWRRRRAP
jgi:hypothetical protein